MGGLDEAHTAGSPTFGRWVSDLMRLEIRHKIVEYCSCTVSSCKMQYFVTDGTPRRLLAAVVQSPVKIKGGVGL